MFQNQDLELMQVLVIPSIEVRLYFWFSMVALLVVAVRVVRFWIVSPPFRMKRQSQNAGYLRLLERWRSSTKQWMGLAFLGWAFVFSHEIGRFGLYADESRRTGLDLLLSTIRGLGSFTEFAALIALILFFAQWHMLGRVQRLREWTAANNARNDEFDSKP
jgi:hypothetical protein